MNELILTADENSKGMRIDKFIPDNADISKIINVENNFS